MSISVTDPLDLAIKKTRAILFEPFDASKWFGLGFCVFLEHLASGGRISGNFNPGGLNSGGGGGKGNPFNNPSISGPNGAITQAQEWIQANMAFLAICVIGGALFIIGLTLILQWLGSRGQFMFIDGIVNNRGDVSRPWHEFESEAFSLFKFKVIWALVSFVLLILVLAGCGFLAWTDFQREQFGSMAFTALVVFGIAMLMFLLVSVTVDFTVTNLIVPTMYKRRINFLDAAHVARDTFMPHKGTVALYFLFLFALGIGVGMVAVFSICCLCCIPCIPYIGTVVLLPLWVFMRSYTLYFLEQFGPDWQFFAAPPSEEVLPMPNPDVGNAWQDTMM